MTLRFYHACALAALTLAACGAVAPDDEPTCTDPEPDSCGLPYLGIVVAPAELPDGATCFEARMPSGAIVAHDPFNYPGPIPAPGSNEVHACGYRSLRGVRLGEPLDVWGPCDAAVEFVPTTVCR
jgi:hypothetical protein